MKGRMTAAGAGAITLDDRPLDKDAAISTAQPCIAPAQIALSAVTDLAAIGPRWRALEARSDASFFQSWTWVGCLAEQRFPDPLLLEVRQDGQDVALALFNRHETWLSSCTLRLGESGVAALDAMFVEHNGLLLAQGRADLLAPCLRFLLRPRPGLRLVLAGVDGAHLDAARATDGAVVRVLRTEPAPFVDFTQLADGPDGFVASLGASTRYQLRRSARRYGEGGRLAVRRAQSVDEAHAMLDELAPLHQATWTSRGQPGAFANPKFREFHQALIASGLPRGEIDLLRITAGEQLIGCLYNFCYGGAVLTYQSGFDYAASQPHQKPGMTCHHMAIEMYRAAGWRRYDFLAGQDRYKTSLANAATTLHWIDMVPRWSLRGVLTRLRRAVLKTIAFQRNSATGY